MGLSVGPALRAQLGAARAGLARARNLGHQTETCLAGRFPGTGTGTFTGTVQFTDTP
jgi:hypothetical protein